MGRASVGGFQALNILFQWENKQFKSRNFCVHMCVRVYSAQFLAMNLPYGIWFCILLQ